MREILFRGKRLDNNEWVYGNYFHYNNENYNEGLGCFYIQTKLDKETLIEDFEVIPETIGQYTGLTDKNGTKIFEGDILCSNSTVLSKLIVHWFERCGGFFLSDNKDIEASSLTPIYSANLYKYVVIGNIHENIELLKGGEL